MSTSVVLNESARSAALKGADWLVSRLENDGSYGAEADDLAYYYKGPYALSLTGHFTEAMRMLDHIKRSYMSQDGDFRGKRKKSEFLSEEFYTYANAWIVIGAQRLGRFDISYNGMDFLLRYRDCDSGGFFSQKEPSSHGMIDTLDTCFDGLACLYLGHLKEAIEAGEFLMRLLDMQAEDTDRFYFRYSPDKGLVTSFPSEEALNYVVDSRKEKQRYFFVGYPVGYLSKLYMISGNTNYLKAADGYFNFAASCRGDVYHYPASGKLGWGSAVAFKATENAKYRQTAEKLASYLVSIQNPDGSWLYDGRYPSMDQQPPAVTFDITQEFVCWLREIALDLR